LHANNEIYNPRDGIPVSLIFLIGDACSNASIDIINAKKKFYDSERYFIDELKGPISDWEALKKFKNHTKWTP